MTRSVLVPLAAGFEEIEAVTVVDVLRRAGAEVVVAGLVAGPCRGSRGVVVVPDATLDEVAARKFDLVALPGGGPGAKALAADPRVLALLQDAVAARRPVAAICAAPTVLAAAGLARGRRLTAHPSVQDELEAGGASVDRTRRVVADDLIVTSQGPGTALEFAYALVARLFGEAKVRELDRGILGGRSSD